MFYRYICQQITFFDTDIKTDTILNNQPTLNINFDV